MSATIHGVTYSKYAGEHQLQPLSDLIELELSEPYTVFTYRFFVNNYPELCFLAHIGDKCVGGVLCKVDINKNERRKGYIGMLVVDRESRGKKIGTSFMRGIVTFRCLI
jgi:peptide alpha-N-acetyltransferase